MANKETDVQVVVASTGLDEATEATLVERVKAAVAEVLASGSDLKSESLDAGSGREESASLDALMHSGGWRTAGIRYRKPRSDR